MDGLSGIEPNEVRRGFDVFKIHQDVTFSRLGAKVSVKGNDGTFQEATTVEANLLYDILKELRRMK